MGDNYLMEETISGNVEKIVFSNEDNGFTVAKLSSRDKDGITIVGSFPSLRAGEIITCKGKWSHHSSHGRQFDVSSFELELPKDLIGIRRYLESGSIRGLGPVNAKRIVDAFGMETLMILDSDPMRLTEIEGIGKKKVESIMLYWEEQKAIREVMIFLRGHGVGPALAKKIHRKYGDATIQTLKENPYTVARDVFGIGFKTADRIASELGVALDSPVRIQAGVEYLLREISEDGHSCYPERDLIAVTMKSLSVDMGVVQAAILALEKEERIIRQELSTEEEPILYVWLRSLYVAEMGIAKQLMRLSTSPCAIRTVKSDKALDWVQEKHHIHLAKEQITALTKSLEEKVHIITGGPGTGKSTVTKTILSIHQKLSDHILLCAPTGKAAKRLSDITRRKAFTIHALLENDFSTGLFKRNIDNPLKCDLIIIDEASMIDTYLMHSLLRAIPDEARVIFIGDIDQLPSIGPGNVLRDMIESGRVALTRLFQIFRQAKGSLITVNAHNINKGIFPEANPSKEKSDFIFKQIETPEEILSEIVKLVTSKISPSYDFDPLRDVQILSPMRRGVIGIENLNVVLQKTLNPSGATIECFGRKFRVRDKVMQIRNNYDKNVFNGDVGFIEEIDEDDMMVTIAFDGRSVEYDFTDLDELVLAYAVSIHKYQGSECPCIIMPVHTSHYKLLQRNLLYTGITRGKELVILLGTRKAILLAIQNNEVKKRHTGLSYFITNKLADCGTGQSCV